MRFACEFTYRSDETFVIDLGNRLFCHSLRKKLWYLLMVQELELVKPWEYYRLVENNNILTAGPSGGLFRYNSVYH